MKHFLTPNPLDMATVSSKVFRHHKKVDGTYNVKICIYHKNERVYIDTSHYVIEKKLTSIFTIKDPIVNRALDITIEDYRETISKLGNKLEIFTAKDLKSYLKIKDEPIDFINFCQFHIDTLFKNNHRKSAANYRTVRYSLIDYFNRINVSIEDITIGSIRGYQQFIESERIITRINQFGKSVTVKSPKLSENSIHNYMRDFRGLYSAAVKHYNNSQFNLIRIKQNPFEHYKITDASETKKRNIDINQAKQVRDCKVTKGGTTELARDLFMLSFYLCGMNAVDLHAHQYQIVGGRVEYNRSKTKGKRKDNAFISIKITPEAKGLLEKYEDLNIRYSSIGNLNKALSVGMRQISELLEIQGLTYYWARHTFANLARNTCRKSKDDVALALNHVDQIRKTTDIYLEKNWIIIDEVQDAVITLLHELDKNKLSFNFQFMRFFQTGWNNFKFTFRFVFGVYFNC